MLKIAKKLAYLVVTAFLRNQTKRLLRRNRQLTVLAITGSVGKTTTKRAIATVLESKFRVLAHSGNYNTETGVPLSLFEQESPGPLLHPGWLKIWWRNERRLRQPFPYDVVVLEMGADQLGEIGYFMRFIRPDIGIVTAVKPAHMEGFKSLDNILVEKFKLAQGSRLALLNADDERLMTKAASLAAERTELYGVDNGEYRFEIKQFDWQRGFSGTLHLKTTKVEARMNLLAKHNIHAVVAAAAVADLLGMTPKQIAAGVAKVRPVSGRMNPLPGQHDSLIIDDSYNANPAAMIAALDTLYALPGRKIAVLGNMNEMGDFSQEYHETIGTYAKDADILATIGVDANRFTAAADIAAGGDQKRVKTFESPYAAGRWVLGQLQPGDKVLVKGSQNGVFAEETVAMLLANPDDRARLVRQSPAWLSIKRKQFSDAAQV